VDDAQNLFRVSRSILGKIFDVSEKELREKLTGEDLEESIKLLPSDNERQFMKIIKSTAPELARIQRKLSVCLIAEVSILEEGKIEYSYNGKIFLVTEPHNSFIVSKKYQITSHDAVQEMNIQDCIKVGDQKIDLTKLPVDELNLLVRVIDRFFFQTYLI